MRFQHSSVMLSAVIAATVGAFGCDDGARAGRAARAPVPVEAVSPPAVDLPLPVTPRPEISTVLVAPPKSATEILADGVEAACSSGEKDQRDGNLGKAREDYQRGLDWLANSGFDAAAVPRLASLHWRLLAAQISLESAFLAQNLSPQGVVDANAPPAAIDEIPESGLPVAPGTKARAERELKSLHHDLPLTLADPVLSYVNFFETPRGRAIVARGLRRSGRYREMIARILSEEGVPQDLIYVAQAESAFEPLALSRARALGIWQFVAGSGRKYGLAHTWWVDERRDPEKSTRAAARYLRDLYGMFGDWYLALAAYNTGEGNVAKAVERTGFADFWELYRRNALLKQTRNYVPIILALALIAKDPLKHGIDVELDAPLRSDVVKPGHSLDLRLAADTVGEGVETLKALNPQLLKLVTPADPAFELRLPEGTADQFLAAMAEIPSERWTTWRRHQVEAGENLAGVARRFGVTSSSIAEANHLDTSKQLESGESLIIPANRPSPTGLGQLVRYRVRRGDTMAGLAQQFAVTPREIEHWNGAAAAQLKPGVILKIYPGGQPAAPASQVAHNQLKTNEIHSEKPSGGSATVPTAAGNPVTHSVQAGETLWSIARAYHTTVEALRQANRFLLDRPLHVGDHLRILPGQ
jgi:membrane-bound lytic murein transglycosylase D